MTLTEILAAIRDTRRLAAPLLTIGFIAGLLVGCVVF